MKFSLMFGVALCLLLLGGCGSVDQYGSRIYDANLNSQNALNQEILLNIVRASRYQSANFMAVSQVSGGQMEQLTTGLPTLSVGPGQTAANHVYQLSNSLQSTVQGGYQSNPLISTAFQNGMMSPVSYRTVALLASTRPREIVFFLLVDGIDVIQGHKHFFLKNDPSQNAPLNDTRTCDQILADSLDRGELKLDPGGECSYTKFTFLMQSLIGNGLTAELDDSSATNSGTGTTASSSTATNSSTTSASGLPGQLCFDEALAGLNAQKRPYAFKNICGPKNPKQSKPTLTKTISSSIKTTADKTETTHTNSTTGAIPPAILRKTVQYEIPLFGRAELSIVMKSPIGVINSLGTFLRDGPFFMNYASVPAKHVLSPGGPYLDVVPFTSSGCYTSLSYMGQYYCVPSASNHTPMIMDMIEALRNLNIQPTDLNSAFTVRLSP